MSRVDVVRKSFISINREERFFCSLLTHGLLSSPNLRRRFFGSVHEVTGIELGSDPGATEVYSEVAWLRDHWRNLGNPRQWTGLMEQDRINLLAQCLDSLGRDIADVENKPFFRTAGKAPKVVTPGRWPLLALGDDKQLALLKWAFNAKPDFLLVCDDRAVIIEAKVESGPGKAASGFSQDEVQEALKTLIPAVAPYLDPKRIGRMWLAPQEIDSTAQTVLWADVADIVATLPADELHPFTRQGLERFARRVQTDS
jgi:hypothetical protein